VIVIDSSSGSLITTPLHRLVEAVATLTGVAVIVTAGIFGLAVGIIVLAALTGALAAVTTFVISLAMSLSAKRTSWNEFSSANASAVICLSTGRKFNFSKYIFDSLVKNIDSSSKFYMYPRVRKGFSRVETPLFKGMIVVQEHMVESIADEQVQDDATITTAPKDVTAAVEEDIQA
nr:hypothetical protein [Tanacetum cinerariifolium]